MSFFNDILHSIGARTTTEWNRERAVERGDATRKSVDEQNAQDREHYRKHKDDWMKRQ